MAGFFASEPWKSRRADVSWPYGTTAKSEILVYMYVSPGMSHGCSAFTVAAFIAAWLSVRRRWSGWGFVGLGSLAALLAMVREQDLFIVVGPAVDFLVTFGKRGLDPDGTHPGRRRLVLNAGLGVAAFAVAFAPQAMAYLVLNGRVWPSDDVVQKMLWTAPYATHVLFSPEHGLFFWTPLAAIGVVGLAGMASGKVASPIRDVRWISSMLLLMFLAQTYVSGSVESWSAAGTFGHRRFVGMTVLMVVGPARSGLGRAGARGETESVP